MAAEPTQPEVKTTTCYMCACRCGIRVHLKDGEIRYIVLDAKSRQASIGGCFEAFCGGEDDANNTASGRFCAL